MERYKLWLYGSVILASTCAPDAAFAIPRIILRSGQVIESAKSPSRLSDATDSGIDADATLSTFTCTLERSRACGNPTIAAESDSP
jgi:hypothetical protein